MQVRVANPADVEMIAAILNAEHVTDYVSTATHQEIGASVADPDEEYLLGETDEVVGVALLSGLANPHKSIELRKIAAASSGRGYGARLLDEVVQRTFSVHDAHRLWLDVFPHNDRARHLYKSRGFVEEGTLRESYYFRGEYRSVVILSMLDREYRQNS